MVFFALLVVGHMISGADGGLGLVWLFGAAIVFIFLNALLMSITQKGGGY